MPTVHENTPTYLSIDLDYWKTPVPCIRYLRKVMALDIPIIAVRTHHDLAKHVSHSDARVLVNVDYHSDLTDRCDGESFPMGCGTWVNFIRWRRDGHFIWALPNREGCDEGREGRCDMRDGPFTGISTMWKSTAIQVRGIEKLLRRPIIACGISVSHNWLERRMEKSKALRRFLPVPSCWWRGETRDRTVVLNGGRVM